jgi:hypothetical protein
MIDLKMQHIQKPKVVNVRDYPFEYPTPYIYVGRPMPSRFSGHRLANPFRIRRNATDTERLECLEKYREWLTALPDRDEQLAILARKLVICGMPLGCWCAPKTCHAEVLAEAILEPMRDIACELLHEQRIPR